MMTFAIITASIVTNVIVSDANFVAINYPTAVRIDALWPVPGIGWHYDGSAFTRP